jgi:hypothetical protein
VTCRDDRRRPRKTRRGGAAWHGEVVQSPLLVAERSGASPSRAEQLIYRESVASTWCGSTVLFPRSHCRFFSPVPNGIRVSPPSIDPSVRSYLSFQFRHPEDWSRSWRTSCFGTRGGQICLSETVLVEIEPLYRAYCVPTKQRIRGIGRRAPPAGHQFLFLPSSFGFRRQEGRARPGRV